MLGSFQTSQYQRSTSAGFSVGIIFAIWGGMIVAGYFIGKSKGRAGLGAALGILGLIGLIIIAVLKPTAEHQAKQLTGSYINYGGVPQQPAAAWWPDPVHRHQRRYWDGVRWTDYVSDHGVQTTDPVSGPQPSAATMTSMAATNTAATDAPVAANAAPFTAAKKCDSCGTDSTTGSQFCAWCGRSLS